ncbi:methylmalonyl Co-A mutase-associated GTPase MeaB [Bacillus rubiinfantis]|uniref:methylmalonyl Co-A mutase-associated GTPase MeaB n=1 Tax=Bacillus rubiinfantis TaxID=1499680 RepID=UPI0005A63EB9|nr:methylmalonyl Co-A mutase-associated GTPase MeaB [Bacillus rubiinfantis]
MVNNRNPERHDNRQPNQFSSVIRKGEELEVPAASLQKRGRFKKRNSAEPTVEELFNGVINGDRSLLARAITLIESNAVQHFQKAQELLQRLLPYSGGAIRIGITGVPGAGKSTFIEAFGSYLCGLGLKVAVLAIDPSSSISGGSILGDKTRMEQLTRNPRAFIRPSPSAGKLGGVHRKTRESMLVCEAAGFDVVLIETVGVGQSEVIIRDMVDFFLLLVLTGAGDELQGMKKGIMELADAIIVHKADGENKLRAEKTKHEYNRILHFLQPATKGWTTEAHTCSSLTGDGIDHIWKVIKTFVDSGKTTGVFTERRNGQSREWLHALIIDQLQYHFYQHPDIRNLLPKIENEVIAGGITVASGAELLFNRFLSK